MTAHKTGKIALCFIPDPRNENYFLYINPSTKSAIIKEKKYLCVSDEAKFN